MGLSMFNFKEFFFDYGLSLHLLLLVVLTAPITTIHTNVVANVIVIVFIFLVLFYYFSKRSGVYLAFVIISVLNSVAVGLILTTIIALFGSYWCYKGVVRIGIYEIKINAVPNKPSKVLMGVLIVSNLILLFSPFNILLVTNIIAELILAVVVLNSGNKKKRKKPAEEITEKKFTVPIFSRQNY